MLPRVRRSLAARTAFSVRWRQGCIRGSSAGIPLGMASPIGQVEFRLTTPIGAPVQRANEETTFEEYCEQRWELEKQRPYQLINAAEFAEKAHNCALPIPSRESHVRPLLSRLEVDNDRIAVWAAPRPAAGRAAGPANRRPHSSSVELWRRGMAPMLKPVVSPGRVMNAPGPI